MLTDQTNSDLSALPPAVCIMGPTASGKTDLAFALVDRFPFEIISVDSALVYRGMDIGTAKPSFEQRQRYPHHLVDILDPADAYSAAAFRRDALAVMQDIRRRGRVPLLVGGTMLYFRALQQGLSSLPQAQPELRRQLQQRLAQEGLPALHAELARLDPVAAARIHSTDPQRTLRALEVYLASGRSLSDWIAQDSGEPLSYRLLKLALLPTERRELHRRIEQRFVRMLDAGLIDEVKALRQRGDLHESLPSMRSVGYRQVWQYLDGQFDVEQLRERGIVASRQLAKRQLTWLRTERDILALDMLNYQLDALSEQLVGFLNR